MIQSGDVLLVTGGCGYLGSQLIRDLAHNPAFAGITIRILDNLQLGDYGSLMGLPAEGNYQFLAGDITDPVAVRRALAGVKAVIHLAAIVRTPLSFDHPTWTEQINHWGTARLVEHCLEAEIERFVFASSASVYGAGGMFDEREPCRPIGPYAQSKFNAEKALLTAMERGLQPTILRFATFAGNAPAMRFHSVANRFAYLAGVGGNLVVYGSGEQTRPFIHIQSASDAVQFCLTEDKSVGEIFNVVDNNLSILQIVALIREVVPDAQVRFTEQDIRTHFSFAVDGSKLRGLGWESKVSMNAGIQSLVQQFSSIQQIPLPVQISQLNWA